MNRSLNALSYIFCASLYLFCARRTISSCLAINSCLCFGLNFIYALYAATPPTATPAPNIAAREAIIVKGKPATAAVVPETRETAVEAAPPAPATATALPIGAAIDATAAPAPAPAPAAPTAPTAPAVAAPAAAPPRDAGKY